MRFLDYCKETHGDSTAQVTVFDINPNMLEVGKERFTKTPYHNSTTSTFSSFSSRLGINSQKAKPRLGTNTG